MKPDEHGMYWKPCPVCQKPWPCLVDPDTWHIDGHYCSKECRARAKESIALFHNEFIKYMSGSKT